jgi:hypothetical protein
VADHRVVGCGAFAGCICRIAWQAIILLRWR